MQGGVRIGGLGVLAGAEGTETEDAADPGSIDSERAGQHGDIQGVTGLVDAHGLNGFERVLVRHLFEHRVLIGMGRRHNEVAQIGAGGFIGGVSEHAGEGRIGGEHAVAMHDDDGLGDAGEHILNEARPGRLRASSRMSHDDGVAEFAIENAVGAFDGEEAAIAGGERGMERAAVACAGEQCPRLGGARRQAPQNVFDRTRDPLGFFEANHVARFSIGKDHLASALKENQHGQSVKNVLLFHGVRVLGEMQTHSLLGVAAMLYQGEMSRPVCGSLAGAAPLEMLFPAGDGNHPLNRA